MSINRETERDRENWVLKDRMFLAEMTLGSIILVERVGRGVPGSIKNPTCRIWIHRTTIMGRSEGRATVRRRIRKK